MSEFSVSSSRSSNYSDVLNSTNSTKTIASSRYSDIPTEASYLLDPCTEREQSSILSKIMDFFKGMFHSK